MSEPNIHSPIPVTSSSMPPLEAYIAEISSLWETRWLTNRGEKVRSLEAALESYFSVPHSVLFANGHLALEVLLESLGLTGEVITTPFTFASTTNAIVRAGLTPVFCDIDPVTFNIDPNKIEELITSETSAILPVHVYGNLCDVDSIGKIAQKHGLKVIYDAAHAFGVSKDGQSAASFGDGSMFSFHATKVFNTVEGGAAVVHTLEEAHKLQRLQNFGITSPENALTIGGNAKMNEFSAAMGLCNLPLVGGEISKRKCVDERYRTNLAHIPGIVFIPIPEGTTHNYAYMPIRIDAAEFGYGRDHVFEVLSQNNILARKYFYPLVSSLDSYKDAYTSGSTPIAARISSEILALPMYADLELELVDQICQTILDIRK